MRTLAIDIETYCEAELNKVGQYAYAQDPSFDILLFAYAFDDDDVRVVDLAQGETIPDEVLRALQDPDVLKTAWNAAFERTCLSAYLGMPMPADQWACTMVHSYYVGLPGSLEKAAKSLRLDIQKDSAGAALIRYFSKPCRATKSNGGRTRNLPEHDLERWEQFKAYCRRDVEVERAIRKKLEAVPVPDKERRLWAVDQKINDRGVAIDKDVIKQAIKLNETLQERLITEAEILTGLDNPNSVSQLKDWLRQAEGLEIESLNKKAIPKVIAQAESAVTQRVLEIRQQLAKTSIKKYQAMERALCPDGRIRGLLQFYGANRTGRWAGRLVQVQNLPRNSMPDLHTARELLKAGHFDAIELLWDDPADVLSQLIRTAIIPSPGRRFIVADFSAIEARVVAWLAGEQWRLDVFRGHGKIYEASASQMFGVPIEKIDKGSELRQKGKIAELALGYGGGVGALKAMGALEMGIEEEELQELVQRWRAANPAIVKLWRDLGQAAIEAVRDQNIVTLQHGITFWVEGGILRVKLPSGRVLHYVRPRIEQDPKFGTDIVTYEGYEQGRWGRLKTYGGKLTENCLAGDTLVLTTRGWVPIKDVRPTDLLWDGVAWVRHQGVVEKGKQLTLTLDGVRLTADHLVLTTGGWRNASSCKGYYRQAVTLPHCGSIRRFRRQEVTLASPLRLRQDADHACYRVPKGQVEVVRLQKTGTHKRIAEDTRYVEAPGLCCVAINDRPLSPPDPPCLEELRRSGDSSLQSLANVRGVLGRHGAVVQTGADPRSDRRQRQLHSGQLSLGHPQETKPQSTEQPLHPNALGTDDRLGGFREVGHRGDDPAVSPQRGGSYGPFIPAPGRYEPVYDIVNAGPRQRFVVLGASGPFIVHNCTQAVARDCLAEAILRLDAAGYDIAFHVHDEVVIDAHPNANPEEVAAIMSAPIEWAPDLPLAADAFEAEYYRKD